MSLILPYRCAASGQSFAFDVDDIEVDEKQVLDPGATVLERTDQVREDANWRVCADPAGHPFCLCVH